MSDILESILSQTSSFCETAFTDEKFQEQGLTRAWIVQFIDADVDSLGSNQQFEVVVAIFYHLVDELYARGCSRTEICALARLTAQYLRESLDRPLGDNVTALESFVEPLVPTPVSRRAAEVFLKYTVDSFLRHFHLYRACLAESRRDLRLRRGVTVEAPELPAALREGRRPDEHQYHCRLREIDTEEQLARAGRASQRQQQQQRRRDTVDDCATEEVTIGEPDDEYPNSLIRDCLEVNVQKMRLRLQDMAESSSIDLIYKAKKTALPRPASMGPPPRFTAASVGGSAADRKSAASSRSSAKSNRKAKAGK